ncbi:DUF317 domain-containing protein [Streptantibioticus ferralitis]|uniref:DUF317 domain-containing protein n=1 Tax=Streptantibioticus ferralitis TaxID=236510 RepID=A0ABT5Z388_9ACTN|nr:DUF317 domain-containing protein [Streptantibioticus ferralitis]MDF2258289.1 DUF317 domain-containing protein [Streptantibioticus ferralitis]
MGVEAARPGFSTTVEALRLRSWRLGPGQPNTVIGQFDAEDFTLIVDGRADVHISSKDSRFSLGWFPLGRPGTEEEGWKLAVTGTNTVPGYSISFDTETPAEIVATTVAKVLATSQPLPTNTVRRQSHHR